MRVMSSERRGVIREVVHWCEAASAADLSQDMGVTLVALTLT